MAEDRVENGDGAVQGLLTRHVFLDTEVYRRFGHNLNSAPLQALGWHIQEGFLHLHITDITLSEIGRQIHDDSATLAQEIASFTRRLERWKSRGGGVDLPACR